ncbi:hypothetical protein [Streptomyces sp. NPDC001843]|uniref:hypothetical protein n=1 Tax=Streptomyces sp. NPDC001843 TaxID=3364617 RepID=UPI00368763D7
MGIRTPHRRTARTRTPSRPGAAAAPDRPSPPVPDFSAEASTARIPADPARAVRRTTAALGRGLGGRLSRAGRAAADLGRGYLALLLARLTKIRSARTMTVFVAPLTARPIRSAAHRPRRDRRQSGPDATP